MIGITLVTVWLYKSKPAIFKGTQSVFNHWGMHKFGSGVNFSIPWNKIIGYKESPNFIFICITVNDAYVLQKRMFDTVIELEHFKDFLEEKISKN